ncbi:carbonic anhydrase, putative [Plasmodium vinckei vinckei]|uniref:Carbonic anhydrase, putative n=1 Tax=Plasmodium vinckei vinckei TaxID=54757 RepID=A0A449BT49_PLAVN|nr:carbonic anhydrase, putative [Plasmodium vinckei vinckei]VEV56573.1 carbonic anhydrase, putative [Plasmodium vinckei vinckei]
MKHIIFLSIVFCFCDNVVYNNYVGRILFEFPDNIIHDLSSGPIVEYEIKEHKDDNPDINKEVNHWNIEINEHKDNPNIQRNNEGNDDSNNNWQYHSNYNDEQSESQNENERNEFSLKNEMEKKPEERKDTQFDKYNEYDDFENMNNNFEENKKKSFEAMQSEDMEDKKGEENKEYAGWAEDKKREDNRDYIDRMDDKNSAGNREYIDGMEYKKEAENKDYIGWVEDKNSAGNRDYIDGMEDKKREENKDYAGWVEDKNSAGNREYIDRAEDKKGEENKEYGGWVKDKNSAENIEYIDRAEDKKGEENKEYGGWVKDKNSAENIEYIDRAEDKKGEENKEYGGWVKDKNSAENIEYIDRAEDKKGEENKEYGGWVKDKNSAENIEYIDRAEDKKGEENKEYGGWVKDKNSAENIEYIDRAEDKKGEENKEYGGWVKDKNSAENIEYIDGMEYKKEAENKEYGGWMGDKQIGSHRKKENNIKSDTTEHNDNLSFEYSKQGMDWAAGICKNGKYQSPVDLHMHTLKERELKNLSDFYLNAFYDNDENSWNNYNRPWFKGDIFYYYENLVNKIIINRQNNMFKIKASNNDIIPFGVLFTTDEPAIFYSHHINFHSPSEHTFEGSGNRRHIEMQIYHSTNEIYDYDESKWNGIFGKKKNQKKNNETNIKHSYILTFLRNSLSNPHLGHQNPKNKKRNKRSKSYNNTQLGRNGKNTKKLNQYQVISITFSSAEINKSTINNFKKLPSEKFLKTILEGTQNVPVGSDPTLVDLKAPLNLNSVLMMLNMKSMEFFAYHGSSTSPDCNENVHWKVAKKSLPISTETMLKFYNMLKKTTPDYNGSDNDNFRALQNVQGNIHNYGRVYLIQGFPVQLLISSILTTSEDKTVIENIKQAYSKSNGNYICFNFIFLLLIFIFLQNY